MNIGLVTLVLRIMSPQDVKNNMAVLCVIIIGLSICLGLFAFIQVAIMNIKTNELILSSKIIQNSKDKLFYQEILQSL